MDHAAQFSYQLFLSQSVVGEPSIIELSADTNRAGPMNLKEKI
jgi:hypothetical protein